MGAEREQQVNADSRLAVAQDTADLESAAMSPRTKL